MRPSTLIETIQYLSFLGVLEVRVLSPDISSRKILEVWVLSLSISLRKIPVF